MLKYEHIEFLNLLFGIPLLILLIIMHEKWKKKALSSFGTIELISKLTPSFSKRKTKIKNILSVLIITLLIVGLANPQIGTKMEEVKRKGVDLIIAVDLSNSMMAEDMSVKRKKDGKRIKQPNRLERSRQAISRLIDKLEGDRIGLIVFAGEAYVQLPITTDYSAAKLFLPTLKTDIMPKQGTEIAKAINLAIESFDIENGQDKAIIIITDGETHDQEAVESAEKAKELGIHVHTLGMGFPKGSPIPVYNKYGQFTGHKEDKEGNTIVSKLNEGLLKEIAKEGEGTYVRTDNSQVGLSALFEEINKMEKKEIGTMIFTEYKDRFQYFIGLALFLLIIDLILLNKKYTFNRLNNLYK